MQIAELLPASFDSDPVLDFEASLEDAARAVDADPWILQRLKHPEREITLNLPFVRDDGSVVNVTAYRIQHSRANGPSIGPVILSPTAHVAKLRMIATEITLQSALLGLRLGGAAGAIVVDPNHYSERELRKLVREYVFALRDNIGPLSDVLVSPHLPTSGRCGAPDDLLHHWMQEANTRAKGVCEPAAVVGRQELRGAIAGATAGLVQHALGKGSAASPVRVAIQGFGNHGRNLAHALSERGVKILAVADRSGGVLDENGIDIATLETHVAEHGVVFGFAGATAITNADILELDCDALVIAAGEKQIGSYNASKTRARSVVELALGAVTSDGASSLPARCQYIPHLMTGAAELAVWDYEWRKGLTYSAINTLEAERDASAMVLHAFGQVREVARERDVRLREAAATIAVERFGIAATR